MAKVVKCRDVGFDCDGVVRAETEDEVLKRVAAHAKAVHEIEEVTPEIVAKVRSVMRDEPLRSSQEEGTGTASVQTHIGDSVRGVIEYYSQHPDQARSQDKEAIAVVEEGLRVRATGPNGQTLVCDMPKALGGGETAPTPGWTMRAALANCEAVMIALRAVQLGITLQTLDVRVGSVSDDRGMLGIDDSVPAGPLRMTISIRIGAKDVDAKQLRQVIAWAEKHSPVGEALTRVVPAEYTVQIV